MKPFFSNYSSPLHAKRGDDTTGDAGSGTGSSTGSGDSTGTAAALSPDAQSISDSLDLIDAGTTAAGTATNVIKNNLTAIIDELRASTTQAQAQALAAKAQAEVNKLGDLVTFLNGVASDSANVVPSPVPVVEPVVTGRQAG